jgi:protein TonB
MTYSDFFQGDQRGRLWSDLGSVASRRMPVRTLRNDLSRRSGVWWSSGLHLLFITGLLLFAPTMTQPIKPEILPIEVAFVDDTTNTGLNPAPPQPNQTLRAASPVKAPTETSVRPRPQRAQAVSRLVDRKQSPTRRVAAVTRQKSVEAPKSADLNALLQARLQSSQAEDDAQLRAVKERWRQGTPITETQPGSGTSVANARIGGSGLSGALATRASVRSVYPVYPAEAQRMGEEGEVRVRLWVAASGDVQRAEVVRSSGRAYFDAAATQAIRQWRFTALPGTGEQWGEITMSFRLE